MVRLRLTASPRNTQSWYRIAFRTSESSPQQAWQRGCLRHGHARNIFLDGNTFRDSRSVDKEPLVGDLQFGIAVTWRNVRLSYTHVLRTREFKTQGEADDFGAFSLSVRF